MLNPSRILPYISKCYPSSTLFLSAGLLFQSFILLRYCFPQTYLRPTFILGFTVLSLPRLHGSAEWMSTSLKLEFVFVCPRVTNIGMAVRTANTQFLKNINYLKYGTYKCSLSGVAMIGWKWRTSVPPPYRCRSCIYHCNATPDQVFWIPLIYIQGFGWYTWFGPKILHLFYWQLKRVVPIPWYLLTIVEKTMPCHVTAWVSTLHLQ